MPALFDMDLRASRRDRAARGGIELFLFERVFVDCLERIALVERRFERGLLIGAPDPGWPKRFNERAATVEVIDPGPLLAQAAGGAPVVEDDWTVPPQTYDLILAIGTLDTVNDLPRALRSIFAAMRPGGLFLGAMAGGDTLPQLRAAMRAADLVSGSATPHVHPRIEPAVLSPVLAHAGFANPVVDVDRAQVTYRSLLRLVADLRAMGATNVLEARSRVGLAKPALAAALAAFSSAGDGTATTETFEIWHFAAWVPSQSPS